MATDDIEWRNTEAVYDLLGDDKRPARPEKAYEGQGGKLGFSKSGSMQPILLAITKDDRSGDLKIDGFFPDVERCVHSSKECEDFNATEILDTVNANEIQVQNIQIIKYGRNTLCEITVGNKSYWVQC